MVFSVKPKACWCLLAVALSACLPGSPGSLPLAAARPVSELLVADRADPTTIRSVDAVAGLPLAPADGQAGALATGSASGRQLTAIPIVGALSFLAEKLLDEFIGIGTGSLVDAILGRDAVPVNLASLIAEALEEVDRIVGDKISEAFRAEKRRQLSSLAQQVREYTRRNNLESTRDDVQDMLAQATDLLAFFHDNAVVTNAAYQVTLSLRLSLQLELLHLDQLIGESGATLARVREAIRDQARDGKAALERWARTYVPKKDTTERTRQYLTRGCTSPGCNRKLYYKGSTEVCMVLESPDLKKPDPFCVDSGFVCKSEHFFEHIRRRRINRCLADREKEARAAIREHVNKTALPQFRERNEATVFGEGFREFLALLGDVEGLEFADVSLPGGSA